MPYSIITSKGQITIPKEVRSRLNLKTGDRVEFRMENGDLKLIPLDLRVADVFGILSGKDTKEVDIDTMNTLMKNAVRDKRK